MSRPKTGRKLEDLEKFPHFVRKAQELFSLKYAQRSTSIQLHMTSTENEPVEVTVEGADEEAFRSYLLTFRMFIMDKEVVQMNKMYKLCDQYFTDSLARLYMSDAYDKWKKLQQESFLEIDRNGRRMTPTEIVDLEITNYFHSNNIEDAEFLEGLRPFIRTLIRHQFLRYVESASLHIEHMANSISTALEQGSLAESPTYGRR